MLCADAVEHQAGRPPTRRGGRLPTPSRLHSVRQAPVDRWIRPCRDPYLLQHLNAAELADRLDQPTRHKLLEHLVTTNGVVEPHHLTPNTERTPRCRAGVDQTTRTQPRAPTHLAPQQPSTRCHTTTHATLARSAKYEPPRCDPSAALPATRTTLPPDHHRARSGLDLTHVRNHSDRLDHPHPQTKPHGKTREPAYCFLHK